MVFEETKASRVLIQDLKSTGGSYHWKLYKDNLTKIERLVINTNKLVSGKESVATEEIKQILVKSLEIYPYGEDSFVAEALGMGLNYLENQDNFDYLSYSEIELNYLIKVMHAIRDNTPFKDIDETEDLDIPTLEKLILLITN